MSGLIRNYPVDDLIDVYEDAARRLDDVARQTKGEFTKKRALRQMAEIDRIIEALEDVQGQWTGETLPEIYVDRRMEDIDLMVNTIGGVQLNLDFTLLDQRRVGLAVQATLGDLQKASDSMKTFYGGWVMRSGFVTGDLPDVPPSLGFTQTGFDRDMTRTIAAGQAAGETRRQTSNILRDMLEKQVGDGGKVVIRGKNGKVFRYSPKKYAAMVARTRTREIATESTRATMQAADEKYGIEPLYKVPRQTSACDICQWFQGKIFSERRNHPKYPWVGTVKIPAHPHCEDVLLPHVELSAADLSLVN